MLHNSPLEISLPPSPALTEFSEPPDNLIPIPLPDSSYWLLAPRLDPDSLTHSNFKNFIHHILSIMSTNNENVENAGSGIKHLEQDNFHQWKGSMLSYFLEHNLDAIVDGTEPKPSSTQPTELANWLLREKKAAGFIARKLDPRNRDLIVNDLNRKDPKALWDTIVTEYASKKARNRSRLFTRFLNLNCSDGDLDRFITSFRQIVKEMSDAGVKLDDDLLAHMALHHLPEDHKTTRTVMVATAESSDTALNLSSVLSQINELVRDSSSNKTTSTALTAKTSSTSKRNTSYERCLDGKHNPKTSHSESDCFQLHPEKKRSNSRLPSANNASINGRVLSTLATKGNDSGKPILDSGASHTMIYDRTLFNTYQPQSMDISVANGQIIKSSGIGSVKGIHQGESVTLNNCLHVPDLKTNLISMGDLAKKGCSIQFKENGKFDVNHHDEVALSGNLSGGVMELDLELVA